MLSTPERLRKALLPWFLACLVAWPGGTAHAWGDEGHEVVGLLAAHFLRPGVWERVRAMLLADTGNTLTGHDIAFEATWADRIRDRDVDAARAQTGTWHFADLEIAAPDEAAACFGHPALPAGSAAYPGVARDCVIDKIRQFAGELADARTAPAERLIALKFLLHLVGDIHQPLHAADDHDRGGNDKPVLIEHAAGGSTRGDPRTLHAFWDVSAVAGLGHDPVALEARLAASITPAQRAAWSTTDPSAWARETYVLAKADAYGKLPPPYPSGIYPMTLAYQHMAEKDAASQLSKAGVRLAAVLNAALGH